MRKWAFNPTTSVLRTDRETEEKHGGEGHGKTEAENELMEPQATEHPGLPAVARLRRDKEGILPPELPLGGTHPATAFIQPPERRRDIVVSFQATQLWEFVQHPLENEDNL